jgi:hypothetical protein
LSKRMETPQLKSISCKLCRQMGCATLWKEIERRNTIGRNRRSLAFPTKTIKGPCLFHFSNLED